MENQIPNPISQPVRIENKSGGFLKCLFIGFFLFGCISCCCVMVVFGFFFQATSGAFSALSKAGVIFDDICNLNQKDLETAYNKSFTVRYKASTSLPEFINFYETNKDVLGTCSERFKNIQFFDFLQGLNLSYEKDESGFENLKISINYKNKKIATELVIENRSWKIDQLTITN